MVEPIDFSDCLPEVDGFCHPDWATLGERVALYVPDEERHAVYQRVAEAWMAELCLQLGEGYNYYETNEFLILVNAPDRVVADICDSCEDALKRILKFLPGVASDEGYGPHVVLVFSDADSYWRYISYFYEDGEHPMSAGISLEGEGYQHFAVLADILESYRGTLAHELTHELLSHLPLPGWLDEALAMRMSEAISGYPLTTLDREELEKHRSQWTAESIQQFWLRRTWDATDDAFGLSYGLASVLWRKIEVDLQAPVDALLEFVSTADEGDAGEDAALAVFGISLGDLVADFLGEGDWAPQPETWPSLGFESDYDGRD